jgi:hypothetical protein
MFGEKKNAVLTWTFLFILAFSARESRSDEPAWGTIEGRFVFDGEPPTPKVIKPLRDAHKFDQIIEESLLVDPKSRGIANVLVFLLLKKDSNLAVHPSYEETANSKILLTTKDGRFEPHISLMRTSQILLRNNGDSVVHSSSIQTFRNPPSGILVPPSAEFEVHYPNEENIPIPVRCNIHPWMNAFILLRDSPYMAKTNSKGEFGLKNLPVGQHEFRLWHEKAGYLKNVSLGSAESGNKSTADKKGRIKIEVVEGPNDFGETKLAPTLFEKAE